MAFNQTFEPAVVQQISDVASDIRLFKLRPEGGVRSYQVGSHLDVQVLVGDRVETRSFSLVDAARSDDCYCIAVKDRPDGHGGSRYLWSLETGARLNISDPKDRFPLSYRASEYLLVAGGIGITPIFGMARALAGRGARLRLLYTARHREQLAFLEELRAELGDRIEIFITGDNERIDSAKEIARLEDSAELYICSPLSLRQDFLRAWLNAGRSHSGFRFETFASSGQYPDEPFTVRVANRDIELTVDRDQSLLQALQKNGVHDVLYDCQHGECGLCTVQVVDHSGTIDHRDVFYSDRQKAGNQRICTCVSRVYQGDLVIDTTRHAVDTGSPEA